MPRLCSAEDVDCIREWVSALSGWAAGAAALLTVSVIAKQIRENRKQHLEFMKFEAHDRLLLVEQVGGQANMALGTVTQIFHEFHDEKIKRSNDKLLMYVDAAKFVLDSILDSEFAAKRSRAQGNLPPTKARAEFALPEFVKLVDLLLALEGDQITEEERISILRGASSQLMRTHEDLRILAEEMTTFRKNWIHLVS